MPAEPIEQEFDRRLQIRQTNPPKLKRYAWLTPVDIRINYPEITPEMAAIIDNSFSTPDGMLVNPLGDQMITGHEIKSLRPRTWLLDSIIDSYIRMLVNRSG